MSPDAPSPSPRSRVCSEWIDGVKLREKAGGVASSPAERLKVEFLINMLRQSDRNDLAALRAMESRCLGDDDAKPFDTLCDLLAPHETITNPRRKRQAREDRKPLRMALVRTAMSDNPKLSEEDAEQQLDIALKEAQGGLLDVMLQLLKRGGVEVRFQGDEPVIDLESLQSWMFLTSKLDPDALICAVIAARDWHREVDELQRWGVTARIGAHDLDSALLKGVADMHVHLGGLRSASLLWIMLIHGYVSPRQVRRFRSSRRSNGLPKSGDKQRVERLRKCVNRLARALWRRDGQDNSMDASAGYERDYGALLARRPPVHAKFPSDMAAIRDLLRAERRMLALSFGALKYRPKPDAGTAAQRQYDLLEHQLSKYIELKSSFLTEHTQTTDTNPGLAVFQRHFSSTSLFAPALRQKSLDRVTRCKRMGPEFTQCVAAVHDSRDILDKLEIRTTPYDSKQEYATLLECWRRTEEKLFSEGERRENGAPRIRFAIHFKRTMADRKESTLKYYLIDCDRQSAVLHDFLCCAAERAPDLAQKIARVDFAGRERDLSVETVAFYLNLLRGDAWALEALDALGSASQIGKLDETLEQRHRCWLQLQRGARAKPALRTRKLGVTCHAGEDFTHPLDGLYEIATAIRALGMCAGDSIGHGLAVGVDIDRYLARRGGRFSIERGRQFDILIWLYNRCMSLDPSRLGDARAPLEHWLQDAASDLYQLSREDLKAFDKKWREFNAVYAARPSLCAFGEAMRLRIYPTLPSDWTAVSNDARSLFLLERDSDEIRARRRELVSLDPIFENLTAATKWAQETLLQEVLHRGVTLELNASSNWRIHAEEAPEDIPFCNILENLRESAPTTICTDDPGTYATRIENEYAIVFQALRARNFDRQECLRVLNQLRIVGLEQLYWPVAENDRRGHRAVSGREHGRFSGSRNRR